MIIYEKINIYKKKWIDLIIKKMNMIKLHNYFRIKY